MSLFPCDMSKWTSPMLGHISSLCDIWLIYLHMTLSYAFHFLYFTYYHISLLLLNHCMLRSTENKYACTYILRGSIWKKPHAKNWQNIWKDGILLYIHFKSMFYACNSSGLHFLRRNKKCSKSCPSTYWLYKITIYMDSFFWQYSWSLKVQEILCATFSH